MKVLMTTLAIVAVIVIYFGDFLCLLRRFQNHYVQRRNSGWRNICVRRNDRLSGQKSQK